jgi:hypothetical protein
VEVSLDDKVTYKYLKSDWSNWQDAAEKLLRVAYMLESERETNRKEFIATRNEDVYYMLIGLALENYLKGAIVQKLLISGESLDEDKLDSVLYKHDIAILFSDAGFRIPDKLHGSYLDYLTECVEWRGRYRLPAKAERIGGSIKYFPPEPKQAGKARISLIEMTHTIPIDVIHEFVDMAKAHLEQLRQKAKAKKL